jgi:hypothetical protein
MLCALPTVPRACWCPGGRQGGGGHGRALRSAGRWRRRGGGRRECASWCRCSVLCGRMRMLMLGSYVEVDVLCSVAAVGSRYATRQRSAGLR